MFILAVATSIDALAVGVTFAFLKVEIVSAVSFIGVITFVCSAAGVKIGSLFGMKYKSKAELCLSLIHISQSTCQYVDAKSTHFWLPSLRAGLSK